MKNLEEAVLNHNFNESALHIVISHKNQLFLVSLRKWEHIVRYKCGTVTSFFKIFIYINKCIDRWAKGVNVQADFYVTSQVWREEIYFFYSLKNDPEEHLLENTIEKWITHMKENFDLENQVVAIFSL